MSLGAGVQESKLTEHQKRSMVEEGGEEEKDEVTSRMLQRAEELRRELRTCVPMYVHFMCVNVDGSVKVKVEMSAWRGGCCSCGHVCVVGGWGKGTMLEWESILFARAASCSRCCWHRIDEERKSKDTRGGMAGLNPRLAESSKSKSFGRGAPGGGALPCCGSYIPL